MEVPLENFVKPQKNFDILNAQVGGVTYNGFKKPLRFEDVPKPTELPPLQPIITLSKKEQDARKLAEENAKAEALAKQRAELAPKIHAPKALLEYINKLILTGRKLRSLAFDVGFADSREAIAKLLDVENEKGFVTNEEKQDMLGILDGTKSETESETEPEAEPSPQNEPKTPVVMNLPERPVRDGSVVEIEKKQEELQQENIAALEKEIDEVAEAPAPEIQKVEPATPTKAERLEKLKNDHGIVVG